MPLRHPSLLCPILAFALAGCDPPPLARDYEVALEVFGDPGRPLADAQISEGPQPIGRSGSDGKVHLLLHGSEGRAVALHVRCPDGYRSPSEPISIVLRGISEADVLPEWQVHCEPLVRTLVIAVRAEHGPNLPVSILGREVARTDALGAAHVLVRRAPEETVELTLDTSASPALRPQNPSARFEVPAHDDVVAFTQSFESRPERAARRRTSRIIRIGAE